MTTSGSRAAWLVRRAFLFVLFVALALTGLWSAHALADTAAAQVPTSSSSSTSSTTASTSAATSSSSTTVQATTSTSSTTVQATTSTSSTTVQATTATATASATTTSASTTSTQSEPSNSSKKDSDRDKDSDKQGPAEKESERSSKKEAQRDAGKGSSSKDSKDSDKKGSAEKASEKWSKKEAKKDSGKGSSSKHSERKGSSAPVSENDGQWTDAAKAAKESKEEKASQQASLPASTSGGATTSASANAPASAPANAPASRSDAGGSSSETPAAVASQSQAGEAVQAVASSPSAETEARSSSDTSRADDAAAVRSELSLYGATAASREPTTSGAQPTMRTLRASPARFANRPGPGRRQGTVLTFHLSAPARLEFTVLGRAPECRRLGMFARKGRAGINRIRFLGRLRGRPLSPGRYTIMPEAVRGRRHYVLASVTVVVVSPERRLSLAAERRPVKAECRSHENGSTGAPAAPWEATGASEAATSQRTGGVERSGVAAVSKTKRLLTSPTDDRLAGLPVPSGIIPDEPPALRVIGLLALGALALAMLFLLVLVLRFAARTWNP
jgi:hypothetical protein